jgi:hypothetical protein
MPTNTGWTCRKLMPGRGRIESRAGPFSGRRRSDRFGAAALRVPSLHTFIMNSNRVYDDMIRFIESLEPADRSSEAPQQE